MIFQQYFSHVELSPRESAKEKKNEIGAKKNPTPELASVKPQELRKSSDDRVNTQNDSHFENMPIQYNGIFHGRKNEKFQMKKKCDLFVNFARYRDCGYSLEPPHRGGSNGYPQSVL